MAEEGRINLERQTKKSTANAQVTVTIAGGERRRFLFVTVKYSGTVTQNVTITLKSHAGTDWDTVLQTIALTANTDGVWIPDGDLRIGPGDDITVVAPAGGAGITAAIAIYLEIL